VVLYALFALLGALAAGALYFLGVDMLVGWGEETRMGRIRAYCTAIEEWDTGRKDSLEGVPFYARLGDEEVPCDVSETPSFYDLSVPDRTDQECGNYGVTVIRCNVSQLIPLPEAETMYILELIAKQDGNPEIQKVGDVALTVLSRRTWRMGHDCPTSGRGCAQQERSQECESLGGRLEGAFCHVNHGLAPATGPDAPCWVLQADRSNMTGGLRYTLADMNWPRPAAEPFTTDYANRCTSSKHARYLHHMTGISLEGVSDNETMAQILQESELTFRHYEDPYVVASRLTDSTFDMGRAESERMLTGICSVAFGTMMLCMSGVGLLLLHGAWRDFRSASREADEEEPPEARSAWLE